MLIAMAIGAVPTAAQVGGTSEGALAAYQRACDEGDLPACYNLGVLHAGGQGVPVNPSAAVALFVKVCNGGVAEGCQALTAMATKFKAVCDDGSAIACSNLGALYANGTGVEKDPARAVTLYRMACAGGSLQGCQDLGASYADGEGVPKDFARAATLFNQACEGGIALACQSLSQLYLFGRGVPQDQARAYSLLDQACDGGEPRSCWVLGLAYRQGEGIERDPVQASALFGQACAGGVPSACEALKGATLGEGGPSGILKTLPEKVIIASSLSCTSSKEPSCIAYGDAFYAGDGATRDLKRAASLFERACNERVPASGKACYRLALLYASGEGVARDVQKAVSLYQRACEQGSSNACRTLTRLGRPTQRPR